MDAIPIVTLAEGDEPRACPTCHGDGIEYVPAGMEGWGVRAPDWVRCDTCNGTGVAPEPEEDSDGEQHCDRAPRFLDGALSDLGRL